MLKAVQMFMLSTNTRQLATLLVIIVKGERTTLLGRSQIILGWSNIHYTTNPGLHELLSKYSNIFQGGFENFKGYKVKINANLNAIHCFYKAWTVPYAIKV